MGNKKYSDFKGQAKFGGSKGKIVTKKVIYKGKTADIVIWYNVQEMIEISCFKSSGMILICL